MRTKDGMLSLQGCWIMELAELSALRVVDFTAGVTPDGDAENNDAVWRIRPLREPERFADEAIKHARWSNNPFDVHAVAEADPIKYRQAVVTQMAVTLTEWGDRLFSEDTAESIAEATQLYLSALDFLGPRPSSATTGQRGGPPLTLGAVLRAGTDGRSPLGDPLVELGSLLTAEAAEDGGVRLDWDPRAEEPGAMTGYFCQPRHEAHGRLWDTLEDRLYKIRHSINLDGLLRALPLFEPPLDPGALIAGAARGQAASRSATTRWVSPHVRFSAMLALAKGLVGSVQRVSSALLQALQSQDAEALGLLRQSQERALLELTDEVRRAQVDEARLAVTSLERTRKMTEHRLEHPGAARGRADRARSRRGRPADARPGDASVGFRDVGRLGRALDPTPSARAGSGQRNLVRRPGVGGAPREGRGFPRAECKRHRDPFVADRHVRALAAPTAGLEAPGEASQAGARTARSAARGWPEAGGHRASRARDPPRADRPRVRAGSDATVQVHQSGAVRLDGRAADPAPRAVLSARPGSGAQSGGLLPARARGHELGLHPTRPLERQPKGAAGRRPVAGRPRAHGGRVRRARPARARDHQAHLPPTARSRGPRAPPARRELRVRGARGVVRSRLPRPLPATCVASRASRSTSRV